MHLSNKTGADKKEKKGEGTLICDVTALCGHFFSAIFFSSWKSLPPHSPFWRFGCATRAIIVKFYNFHLLHSWSHLSFLFTSLTLWEKNDVTPHTLTSVCMNPFFSVFFFSDCQISSPFLLLLFSNFHVNVSLRNVQRITESESKKEGHTFIYQMHSTAEFVSRHPFSIHLPVFSDEAQMLMLLLLISIPYSWDAANINGTWDSLSSLFPDDSSYWETFLLLLLFPCLFIIIFYPFCT